MRRSMMKSKIHRATVTEANLDYEGSVTIDRNLLEAADILPFEEVHLWNVTNGNRLITYAMEGPSGEGTVCVNGAGAHLMHPGDIVIIATYTTMSEKAARKHKPIIVYVDAQNRRKDPSG